MLKQYVRQICQEEFDLPNRSARAVGGAVQATVCAVACGFTMSYLKPALSQDRSGPNYFFRAQVARVRPSGLRVQQEIAPPRSATEDAATYSYFPATDYAAYNSEVLTATTDTDRGQLFVWANCSNRRPRLPPNALFPKVFLGSGVEGRIEYTTVSRADAATEAEIAYSMCLPAHGASGSGYMDIANAAGIPDGHVLGQSIYAANPPLYFNSPPSNGNPHFRVAYDMVWLPLKRLCDAASPSMASGFMLDWEVQDGRKPDESSATLTRIAQMIHGQRAPNDRPYEAILYNNPLDGAASKSGIDESNAGRLANIWDLFGLLVWPEFKSSNMAAELDAQAAIVGSSPPYSRLFVTVGIGPPGGELSNAQARAINAWIVAHHIPLVHFWRDGGLPGGPASSHYNQVIGLVTGICSFSCN